MIEAMRDDNWGVLSAASSALGEISLQQLIETYWATQNQGLKQGLIPIIATQLCYTPLLVRTSSKPHHQQIVLYPTAGQHVKWEKPLQEVQNFVTQIQSAVKQYTPLMSAAANGHLEEAQLLVDKGSSSQSGYK